MRHLGLAARLNWGLSEASTPLVARMDADDIAAPQRLARQLAFKVEKRELKDQLMHADRLATIGQLAAGIAHELNNPLTCR